MMIELTLLMPQDLDPHPMKEEDLFLWQAEAAVLEEAPEPSEADAQEIAFYAAPATELLRLRFNTNEPALQDRVAGFCNSLYALHGTDGLRAFANGILEGPTAWNAARAPRAPLKPPLKGEQVYRGDATPKRQLLATTYISQKKKLDTFIGRATERIQLRAREVVDARLKQIDEQLVFERMRYRTPAQGSMIHAPEMEENLSGLAQAMWEIATLRRELAYFDDLYVKAQHAPASGYYVPSYADFKKRTELVERDQARIQETLVGRLVEHCKSYPILHRLWNHDVVFSVADAWGNNLPKDRQDKVIYGTRLLASIDETLDAIQAARGLLQTELNETPEVVWRYSPVINEALKLLRLGQGDIAWMAAQEKLASFKGAMGPFAKLSVGIGLIDDLAGLGATSAPGAALLAAACLASSIGELIESLMEEEKKDRAFAACLNPADSFSAEQGSYIGAVIGALFVLFQLRGVLKSGRPL